MLSHVKCKTCVTKPGKIIQHADQHSGGCASCPCEKSKTTAQGREILLNRGHPSFPLTPTIRLGSLTKKWIYSMHLHHHTPKCSLIYWWLVLAASLSIYHHFYCFLSLLVVAIFQSHRVPLPECVFRHHGSLTVFS